MTLTWSQDLPVITGALMSPVYSHTHFLPEQWQPPLLLFCNFFILRMSHKWGPTVCHLWGLVSFTKCHSLETFQVTVCINCVFLRVQHVLAASPAINKPLAQRHALCDRCCFPSWAIGCVMGTNLFIEQMVMQCPLCARRVQGAGDTSGTDSVGPGLMNILVEWPCSQ